MTTYHGYHTETFKPAITAECSMITKQMHTHSGTHTETFKPSINNVVCSFTTEQSGDTPI